MKRSVIAISFSIGCCVQAPAADLVTAEFASDRLTVKEGEAFRIGVLFTIPDGAHIYWRNPGDSGLPTTIDWNVPPGFAVGGLQWPQPAAFYDEVLDETSFGYERGVLLFAEVQPPADLEPGVFKLGADAVWLVCLDGGTCIAEEATVEIALQAGRSSSRSALADHFDAFATRLPRTVEESDVPVEIEVAESPEPMVRVRVGDPWRIDGGAGGTASAFFPDQGRPWRLAEPLGEGGAREIAFVPPGKFDGSSSGAITLWVRNTDTERWHRVYLRVGKSMNEE